MTRRFRFLVVDDRHGPIGCSRPFSALKLLGYLPSNNPENHDDSNAPLAYSVVCPLQRSGKRFLAFAVEMLSQSAEYDFFFFDVDLTQQVGDVDKSELRNLNATAELCGLDLAIRLPQDQRPKILFTAVSERRLLLAYSARGNPRQDWITGDIEQTVEFANHTIGPALEKYLLAKQRDVLRRLSREASSTFIEELRRWEERIVESDSVAIPDGNDSWTLRTLFPRETISAADSEVERAAAGKRIRTLLRISYPSIMSLFMNHPATNPGFREIGGYDRAAELARLGDLVCTGKAKTYRRFSDLPHLCSARDAQTLRDRIIRAEDASHLRDDDFVVPEAYGEGNVSIAEYFSKLGSDGSEWDVFLEDCAKNHGIYPFDLWYLSHVTILNGEGFGNSASHPVIVRTKLERDERTGASTHIEIAFVHAEAASQAQLEVASRKLKEGLRRVRSARPFGAALLVDEGLGDVVAVVVGRYAGSVTVRTGGEVKKKIVVTLPDTSEEASASLDDNPTETAELVIRIPRFEEIQ